jgi:hypothetical protein
MKTVYQFDTCGYFIGMAEADESPLEPGVYLVPAFSTPKEPPSVSEREVAIFDNGQWRVAPNWRGVPLFSTTDGSPVSVDVGVLPADVGATDLPMPGPEYIWREGAWEYDAERAAALFRKTRERALTDLLSHIAAQRDTAAGNPTPGEMQSRTNKRMAAEASLAGQATEAQSLNMAIEAELRGMGESPEVLARKIVQRAQALDEVNAKIDGLKRAAENALLSATTQDELHERSASFTAQIAAIVAAAIASE